MNHDDIDGTAATFSSQHHHCPGAPDDRRRRGQAVREGRSYVIAVVDESGLLPVVPS